MEKGQTGVSILQLVARHQVPKKDTPITESFTALSVSNKKGASD
ncbi:MAG: hypothetical protein ACI8VI_001174 [Granulosicoccus sp.]|jgi:hypothetical protein